MMSWCWNPHTSSHSERLIIMWKQIDSSSFYQRLWTGSKRRTEQRVLLGCLNSSSHCRFTLPSSPFPICSSTHTPSSSLLQGENHTCACACVLYGNSDWSLTNAQWESVSATAGLPGVKGRWRKRTRVPCRVDSASSISVRVLAKKHTHTHVWAQMHSDTYVLSCENTQQLYMHTGVRVSTRYAMPLTTHTHLHTWMEQPQRIWCHFPISFVCTLRGDKWDREWQQQVSWPIFCHVLVYVCVSVCVGVFMHAFDYSSSCYKELRSNRILSCKHIHGHVIDVHPLSVIEVLLKTLIQSGGFH